MNDDFMLGVDAYEEEAKWQRLQLKWYMSPGFVTGMVGYANEHYKYLLDNEPTQAEPFKHAMLTYQTVNWVSPLSGTIYKMIPMPSL